MNQKELNKVLERHHHFLAGDCKGNKEMKAVFGWEEDLSGLDLRKAHLNEAVIGKVDLSEANLNGALLNEAFMNRVNLSDAKLRSAELHWADLSEADLAGADFTKASLYHVQMEKAKCVCASFKNADLRWAMLGKCDFRNTDMHGARFCEANLVGADFSEADLRFADFSGANLIGANFKDAILDGAIFTGANLMYAKFSEGDRFRTGVILDKPMKGYKRTLEGVILTAEIPAGAVVFCVNGGKCRTNVAKIISTGNRKELHSRLDYLVTYRKGDRVVIKGFDLCNNAECSTGFHFFRTREAAEAYTDD
jgi:uncharacterized protein YjbI with pentapeptide repeats